MTGTNGIHFRVGSNNGAGRMYASRGSAVAQEPETLGKRVARLRKAMGLSQYALAKAASVSIPYVQKLEKDKIGSPSFEHLARIGTVLNQTPEQLTSGDEALTHKNRQVAAERESVPALVHRIVVKLQDQNPDFQPSPRSLRIVEQVLSLLPVLDESQQESVANIVRGLAGPHRREMAGDNDEPPN